MRVGSVVQLESPKSSDDVPSPIDLFIVNFPQVGVDYTVESVEKCDCCGETYISLDQIYNPFPSGKNIPLPAEWFRELQDPLGNGIEEEKEQEVSI